MKAVGAGTQRGDGQDVAQRLVQPQLQSCPERFTESAVLRKKALGLCPVTMRNISQLGDRETKAGDYHVQRKGCGDKERTGCCLQ